MTTEQSARFWRRVGVADLEECWPWRASTNTYGYGQFSYYVAGKVRRPMAHRLTYEILRGPIPTGHHLHHLCGVRACCNPWHLEPITLAEHNRHHKLATHCWAGHPFTYSETQRRNVCFECAAINTRIWKAKRVSEPTEGEEDYLS